MAYRVVVQPPVRRVLGALSRSSMILTLNALYNDLPVLADSIREARLDDDPSYFRFQFAWLEFGRVSVCDFDVADTWEENALHVVKVIYTPGDPLPGL